MFYIAKETLLTPELLEKYINEFVMNVQPKLEKWKNYYDGKHVILQKTYKDKSKPCNKIVTNYCKIISDTYNGYIVGKPISYSSNNDITAIQDVINYNDSDAEDIKWLSNALNYSVGYELYWLDKEAQVRYSQVNPLESFAIFGNDLDSELMYFVRWYKLDNFDDNDWVNIEVYDANKVTIYKANGIKGQMQLIEERVHHFGDVPVSVFYLNENETNIYDDIITLNDAYNTIQSSEVDDYQAFVDAFLCLQGMDAEKDDVASMKENRVLLLPEGGKAEWLTKNTNDTQIENMLTGIKKNIFKVTNCPDMGDENFMAQSGVAIQYKLVGFENMASGIVARFTKAVQRRIELICNVLHIKGDDNAVWRDINISFTRNLPSNITETIQLVNSLKGIVSDATLLSQLPFIDDVQAEIEAVNKQKEESMAIFGFNVDDDEVA